MLSNYPLDRIKPNSWNPNKVDPVNQYKLEKSLAKYGQEMPIILREVISETGQFELEIVDGEHRFEAAKSLGWTEMQAINLGEVSVEDAKRKTIIANTRYGKDEDQKLFALLTSDGVFGTTQDILDTLPIDETELTGLFSSEDIDFSDLDNDDDLAATDPGIELDTSAGTGKQHRIIRFKVGNEDADAIEALIEQVRADQGFTNSDAITNAGDALVHILLNGKE